MAIVAAVSDGIAMVAIVPGFVARIINFNTTEKTTVNNKNVIVMINH